MKIEKEIDTSAIKRVGKIYENPARAFAYIDIKYEPEKWADSSKYLPAEFDLCYCKIKNRNLSLPGWYTGISWDGLNIKPEYEVLFWKLNYDN